MSRFSKIISTSLLLSVAMPFAAHAQSAPAAAADAAASDEAATAAIVVLGTRRTDRTVVDSASPIDVIGAAELSTQPASNLLDVVRNLIPSFYVGQNSISDASTFVRSPSLRGLPADNILVMLNGKRFNRSALVQVYNGSDTALGFGSQGSDISSIPAIAIKSLQVLREGATAQYGSDAIGGVLNYGLRDNTGVEVQARYGQFYEGDGQSIQVAGNVGFKLADRGFVNFSGEFTNDRQTSRGVTRPIALEFARLNPSLASQLPNFPGPVQIWGSSPSESYKLVLNSGYEINDEAKVYFFANVAQLDGNQSFNFRSPIRAPVPLAVNDGSGNPATRQPGRNGAFSHPAYLTPCPAVSVGCPTGGFVKDGNVFNFSTLYPAGFTPRFIGRTKEATGTIGVKGTSGSNFTYDISGTLARNSLTLSMTNSLNQSFGPQSQTSFKFGSLIQTELNANIDLTYAVDAGLASPITFSAGAEYRREKYETTQGDLQSYAAGPFASQALYVQTAPGVYARSIVDGAPETVSFLPGASGYGGASSGSALRQTNFALYLGAEADLTDKLTVGATGRYERYNTFGGVFVGKVNAIYKIVDQFSVRGTIGTGFHAPSPGQQNTEILTTAFRAGTGEQVQTGTYRVNSSISRYFGAVPLGPERSTNFGAGFVFNPSSALTLTVDGYIIKVRNRIGISRVYTVTTADLLALPALAAVGDGGDVQYFTNAFDTTTRGIDAVASYRTDVGTGKLNMTLAYNYNRSKVTRFDPAQVSAARVSDISNFAPNHRIIGSAGYVINDFSFNARGNFYSSWSAAEDYPGQVFGSKVTADLDASYTFDKKYTLTLGANNLFNTRPDRIRGTSVNPIYALTNSTGDGQIYPRSGGPFGFNGGFWYIRARVVY
jgi:iron complex outermembrane receptor protein